MKHFKLNFMARTKKRTCDVTGLHTSVNNFYNNQRRLTGASKIQMSRMFNQLSTY